MTGYYAPEHPSRTERVLTSLAVGVVVLGRRGVLGWWWASEHADAMRERRAQRRGTRLARRMLHDGTLDARSPRKEVRLP